MDSKINSKSSSPWNRTRVPVIRIPAKEKYYVLETHLLKHINTRNTYKKTQVLIFFVLPGYVEWYVALPRVVQAARARVR